MTEHRRIPGDPRLGFRSSDLDEEECVECGAEATVAVEDDEGYLTHYCGEHAPRWISA